MARENLKDARENINTLVRYEVRFILYHRNSWDGRNGYYPHNESFSEYGLAQAFLVRLRARLKDKEDTHEWASAYCWDGFLERVDGLYKITEEKI